ncbi:hypothetical protein AAFF_G00049580 [Aldrovandia affinis]|uniref:Uncharacterized protein n=1 Tax=Aldrovandia affinis TaxID=143900 RepID=A0AAD7WET1_9TELE|nr:hypothetical protein AAFF_G00049580 [Aldrovandia affinis]
MSACGLLVLVARPAAEWHHGMGSAPQFSIFTRVWILTNRAYSSPLPLSASRSAALRRLQRGGEKKGPEGKGEGRARSPECQRPLLARQPRDVCAVHPRDPNTLAPWAHRRVRARKTFHFP